MRVMVAELRYAVLADTFIGTFKPYTHQLRTLTLVREAIAHNQTICIENTSVTGSGKTLANFAAAVLDSVHTCGVYPTNELIFDQYASLFRKFPKGEIALLDSQGLDDIIAEQTHMRSHAHALAWATGDAMQTAVLTNPDVLYLAMYNLYGQMFNTFNLSFGTRVFRYMLSNYPVIAFDEFHLYNAKQIANAAFIMGTAKVLAPRKPHVFIFSSATPQPLFREYVQRLEIPLHTVTDTPVESGQVVCEPLEVNFLPANLLRWQGGETIRTVLDEILAWADSCTPHQARGVFIVDSVYEAKALAAELRQRYPSKDVGEVHGYMDPDARAGALHCRFSVGTTTIDVGVDLTDEKSKEFLVAEARSAAQAVQRLGRLGRHGREPQAIHTPNRAWLAVPDYVYQYVQRVDDGAHLSRDELNSLLRQAYLGHEEFYPYTRKYSPLEAVAACERVIHQQPFADTQIQEQEVLHRLLPTLYEKEVPPDQEQAEQVYKKYRNKQLAIWSRHGTEIKNPSARKKHYYLSDLESFRGGMESDFSVALYDDLDKGLGLKPVKVYNLPFVLRRTRCEELSKQEFEALVRREHPAQADEWLAQLARQHRLLGYVHIHDLIHDRANEVYFEINQDAIDNQFQRVIRLEGLTIDGGQAHLRRRGGINEELQKRKLNCWVSERNSFRLNETLHLPPLFAIYALHALHLGGASSEWSVAFGLDAFLLASITKRAWLARARSDNTAIIL